MNNIGSLLSVFENLLKSEAGSKKIIEEVFQDVLGVKLDSSKINVEEFRLYLDVHPVIKNEITLHREELLERLKSKTGKSFDSIN